MFGLFTPDNPWIEDPVHAGKAAVARCQRAALAARKAAGQQPSLARDLLGFADQAERLARAWETDVAGYRRHRAFAAVVLPDLIDLASLMADGMDPPSGPQQDSIRAAFARLAPVLADCAVPTKLDTLLDSLAPATLPAPPAEAEAPASPPAPSSFQALATMGKGLLHKTAVPGALAKAQEGGKALWDGTTAKGGALAQQGWGITTAGLSWARYGAEEGLHTALQPWRSLSGTMAAFSPRALLDLSITAGVLGALTALVFPPLVPLVVGMATLDHMDAAQDEACAVGKAQIAAAQAKRREAERALAKALGQETVDPTAPQVFGTPHLRVVADPMSGAVAMRVLQGRYAGMDLVDLDGDALHALLAHAPDDGTAPLLRRWNASAHTRRTSALAP